MAHIIALKYPWWELPAPDGAAARRRSADHTTITNLTSQGQTDAAHKSKLDWSFVAVTRRFEVHRFLKEQENKEDKHS